MNLKLLSLLLLTSITSLIAQEGATNFDDFSILDRTEFKVGYTGNLLWNNGLQIGAEYLLKENIKIKEKKRKEDQNVSLTNGLLMVM